MKRFFCKVCKQIRRARHFPLIIENPDNVFPLLRVGECNWHAYDTRSYLKVRRVRDTVKTVSVAAKAINRKTSKRGR
jgi:hypothetical protein